MQGFIVAKYTEKLLFEDIFEEKETWFDRLLLFLFPHLEIMGTKYELLWKQRQELAYRKRFMFTFVFIAFLAITHIFMDMELGLKPLNLFIAARASVAIVCVLSF